MRAALALFLALGMSGCGNMPKEALVPVPVPCRVEKPKTPVWETSKLPANAGIWAQAKALLAERRQMVAYQAQLEAAIAGCNDELPAKSATLGK